MFLFKRSLNNLFGLLFPNPCCGCQVALSFGESYICTICLYQLPYTDHHLDAENRMMRQFWGRIPCHSAMAMLYFRKGGRVQELIHHLKYSKRSKLGVLLGQLLGKKLLESTTCKDIDLIIPVPLHKSREKKRGYNQSACIAEGISQVLQIPYSNKHLIRIHASDSQTHKGRYLRFENMSTIFILNNMHELQDLHILLVDDVSTTGATLESCGIELLRSGLKKLSFATLAFVS